MPCELILILILDICYDYRLNSVSYRCLVVVATLVQCSMSCSMSLFQICKSLCSLFWALYDFFKLCILVGGFG